MKLLFVTCIKEDQPLVAGIFEKAGVQVYSVMEAVGYRSGEQGELLDSWFASGGEKADSVVAFSFTSRESAYAAMDMIKAGNEKSVSGFPVRVFILPVEQMA
ncbi:MAG: hypothetical protein U0X40_03370 [Ferruginibacter sp.]